MKVEELEEAIKEIEKKRREIKAGIKLTERIIETGKVSSEMKEKAKDNVDELKEWDILLEIIQVMMKENLVEIEGGQNENVDDTPKIPM